MGAADLLRHVRAAGFTIDQAGDKLLVTPASMLTDELRAALRASKPEVLALLARSAPADDVLADTEDDVAVCQPVAPVQSDDDGQREAFDERAAIMEFDGGLSRVEANAAALALLAGGKFSASMAQSCARCRHFGRHRTCLEPVAAGLLMAEKEFAIVWPPEGHGAACPAFTGTMPTAAADRPQRLTNDEADRCHEPCGDDAEIAAFTARTERFALLGRADADDLAEPLPLRELM